MLNDLRYAVRRFRRQPGFVAPVVVTLGLAIGLASAIYAVAEAVLLRPFPYRDPDRLVAVWKSIENVDIVPFSIPEFSELRRRADVFDDLGGVERDTFDLFAPGLSEHVDAYAVTANLFDMLGVGPLIGRAFRRGDDEQGRACSVILDESFWRRAFGADRAVVGRWVRLPDAPGTSAGRDSCEVVGVVSSRVRLVYRLPLPVDVYVPRPVSPDDRLARDQFGATFFAFGRLAPGVTVARAGAEVRAVIARLSRLYPRMTGPHAGARVTSLHDDLVGQTRPAFVLLGAAALVVFLAGCVNVANLLLADRLRRREHVLVRLALGCSRARLMRQLLVEQLLLSLLAAVLGLLVARWATPVLLRLAPATVPRIDQVRVDGGVIVFAAAAALMAGIVSGIVPAWLLTRARAAGPIALAPATVVARNRAWRSALIVVETALVFALLAAGGVIAGGLWRLAHLDLGFDTRGVSIAQVNLPARWSSDERSRLFEQQLLVDIRANAGISGATATSNVPFANGALYPVKLDAVSAGYCPTVVSAVDPGYLAFLGVPLRTGRMLAGTDRGARVAIVNESLARRFPGGHAVGHRIRIGGDEWLEVVGVVGDISEIGQIRGELIKLPGFTRLTLPAAYVPSGTIGDPFRYLLVRSQMPIDEIANAIRRATAHIDPDVTGRVLGRFDERVASVGADKRFYAAIVLVFGGVALFLAAVGLYAVLAHTVAQRTREIGIRVALGAVPARIRWMVGRDLIAPVGAGIVAGLAAVAAVGRLLRAFVFEISPTDPLVLAAVTVLVMAVAGAATYLPARRATGVDPARALRYE